MATPSGDYGAALEGYRVEIGELEARARATREGWFSTDFEVNQREAEELDCAALSLRQSLAQIIRAGLFRAGYDEGIPL